jgi:pyruvate dehydrogenase E2 component (dihydrolipoamide acetyltransferase)
LQVPNTIDIKVPDLGDFSDVDVIEVLVKSGDRVAKEDGLITLETDKAAMDVPAEQDGEIEEITVSVGDKVSTGDVIGRMKVGAGEAVESEAEKEGGQKEATVEETAAEPAEAPKEQAEAKGAKAEPKGGGKQSVKVPDIGDFTDVDVIEVHVDEGDEVAVEDPLITLETDKAAMDVPSTVAGTIASVLVKVGDKVSEGSEIAVVEVAEAAEAAPEEKPAAEKKEAAPKEAPAEKAAPAKEEPARQEPDKAQRMPAIDEAGFARAHASPSVRKLARELGVDLVRVKGSGPKNRILHEDVKAFVKAILTGEGGGRGAALPEVPKVDFAKFGEIERRPLTRIKKIAAPRLQASWINLPHVTQHDLADITELEQKRQELKGPAKERGINLTPLAFVMRACVAALREFPQVNASLAEDGEHLVLKKYIHLGFAADTEQGLVVPVIRDADKKDVYEIATELGELSKAAREGKLKSQQIQGASFTISSLGGIGGTAFTPIVNAPEVAILGVSRSSMQPVWDGEAFKPRLMLPLSLSYDHRVIDGADAARFTTHLGKVLADVESLLKAIP